jgi:hypothetical protein
MTVGVSLLLRSTDAQFLTCLFYLQADERPSGEGWRARGFKSLQFSRSHTE